MTARCIARWTERTALIVFVMVARLHAQADGTFRWPNGSTVGGLVDSSPALSVAADGTTTIYVGVEDNTTPAGGHLVALDRNGSILWDFKTLKPSNPVDSGVSSSPTIGADGVIYFGCQDGKLYALDPVTRTKKWEFDTHAIIYTTPTLAADGSAIYVVSGDSVLHAVSATDHVELWRHAGGYGYAFTASLAVAADGTIYFGASDGNLVALHPDGTDKWNVAARSLVYSCPAVASDGTVYFTSYNDGRLLAVSSDGVLKWTFTASGVVAASPVIGADGTIYFGDGNGVFYAVNPDGTPKWKNPSRIGAPIVSTAAVRADGTIIFGAHDFRLHALNPDGTEKWKTNLTGDEILSSPVIAPDGTIYVGSEDGKVYAVNGTGSPLSTVASWPMLHHDVTHTSRARAATGGAYLVNLSTYAQAGGSANLIAGFVVQGSGTKRFLLRAVGPTLARLNVPNVLADPALSLVSAGNEVGANDNWSSTSENFLSVLNATNGVTFQLGSGEKDAAIALPLAPGNYNAVVKSSDGGTGVALVEAYDLEVNSTQARLVNLSTRARAGSGSNVLIAGLVIGGQGPLRLLVRAIGPGLAQFGVNGVLAQPTMTLYSEQTPIGGNVGWTAQGLTEDLAAAARLTGAFALSASAAGSADCAAVVTLTPGSYTIQVSGVGGTTGEALVEVYVIP